MEKLYVAYGSNLNIAQMALRCPTAQFMALWINWSLFTEAVLPDHTQR